MENLTENQKNILTILEKEFNKINEVKTASKCNLINIDKIKNLINEGEKEEKEIILYNNANEQIYKDYKKEVFTKLKNALNEINISIEEFPNSLGINKSINIYFKAFENQYFTSKNNKTLTKKTFTPKLEIYFNPNYKTSFNSLEELCEHEYFEKLILLIIK
jgi:hypothetical protein